MRYTKETLKEFLKDNIDYYNYIIEYIEEVEKLNAKFKYIALEEDINDENHSIFVFEVDESFNENKELLNRDDDSQPHNTYRIFFGDLFIYETRYI